MNKLKITKIMNSLKSETNLDLFLQICKKPRVTSKIRSNLSNMPVNRRINILEDAGLVERPMVGRRGLRLFNKPTDLGKKILKLLDKI